MQKLILIKNVPFFSQRLDKNNYKIEGFTNVSRAKYWSSRICGLACLKMAIHALTNRNIQLFELLQKGLEINAYSENVGWYHNGLVKLAQIYGLRSWRESIGQEIEKIGEYVAKNEIVIASVTVGFDPIPPKGGHLVTIYGVEKDSDRNVSNLILHHPSSWKSYEFSRLSVDREKFLNSFSHSGNIIRMWK